MSKARKILKEFNFNETETIQLSDQVSFSFSNLDIVQFILDNKYNKISLLLKKIDSYTINMGASYIEFVGAKIKEQLFYNIEETKKKYQQLIEDQIITSYHKNLENSFIIEEIAEILTCRLVQKNKHYLTKTTIFHSSFPMRLIQTLFIKYREKDVEKYYLRKTTLKSLLDLFCIFQFQHKYKQFINVNHSELSNSFSFNEFEIIFNPDKNLIDNFYLNIKDKKAFSSFINSEPEILIKLFNEEKQSYSEPIKHILKNNFFDTLLLSGYFEDNTPAFLEYKTFNEGGFDNGIFRTEVDLKNRGEIKFYYKDKKIDSLLVLNGIDFQKYKEQINERKQD